MVQAGKIQLDELVPVPSGIKENLISTIATRNVLRRALSPNTNGLSGVSTSTIGGLNPTLPSPTLGGGLFPLSVSPAGSFSPLGGQVLVPPYQALGGSLFPITPNPVSSSPTLGDVKSPRSAKSNNGVQIDKSDLGHFLNVRIFFYPRLRAVDHDDF
ncbi:hypothetical protein CROQUDRAFT_97216 [Cronartium quercuum f. sp. fusiforme G11]|uniref:Uncharacterized protein n=1 Tax=Cronartium quercuum f. sp. fusiforme G11 TaxID=708437 RepID=A0A9P6T9N5_9BASI|nr:hypothetical protein CROQUDRAFT_97216 [Cronartium quercuum f. sp. fusiforme G11]